VTLRTGSDRLFVGRVETDSDELVERCAALVQDAERTESGARQRPGLSTKWRSSTGRLRSPSIMSTACSNPPQFLPGRRPDGKARLDGSTASGADLGLRCAPLTVRAQGSRKNSRWGRRRGKIPVVPIRVFLLDDHELVRTGLRTLLETEEDMEIVGRQGPSRRRSPAFLRPIPTWPSSTCACPTARASRSAGDPLAHARGRRA